VPVIKQLKNACPDWAFRSYATTAGITINAANGAKTAQAAMIVKLKVL